MPIKLNVWIHNQPWTIFYARDRMSSSWLQWSGPIVSCCLHKNYNLKKMIEIVIRYVIIMVYWQRETTEKYKKKKIDILSHKLCICCLFSFELMELFWHISDICQTATYCSVLSNQPMAGPIDGIFSNSLIIFQVM